MSGGGVCVGGCYPTCVTRAMQDSDWTPMTPVLVSQNPSMKPCSTAVPVFRSCVETGTLCLYPIPGSYRCKCNTGFRLDANDACVGELVCVHLMCQGWGNVCSRYPHPCRNGPVPVPGSYRCECNTGFSLDANDAGVGEYRIPQ